MLRVVAHKSAAAARQYYTEGLKREDYYSEGQEVVGKWHGKAAEKLGITGDVKPEAFAALVENRHPVTGERLTPRTKADRRVGYDLNFHAPKSLSVIHALTGDSRIVAAFREAVAETMAELEEKVGARVRKGGSRGNRVTGNFAWAEFVHFTARPVGGVPDPHLHVHAFTFNCTFDATEKRWKAAEFHDIKVDAPYAEASFHARLAQRIAGLGYGIERTKSGWEIAGLPASVIAKFSRRKAQIEDAAERMGISDAKRKDELGALTREGKRRGLTHADLAAQWNARLSPEESAALAKVRSTKAASAVPRAISAKEAIDHAFEKCFAKNSVIVQNRLVSEALKYSLGQLKPEQLWRELAKRELVVRDIKGEILCTPLDVLAEEVSLIGFVREGRGKCPPIRKGRINFKDERLSAEQRNAVASLLRSTSQVIAIRGGAGVGKTTLMAEAAAQIVAQGHRIFAFAPSAAASRDTLREAGFSDANTVAHLLLNKELQQRTRGQIIWIDEAGLLGTRELWQVMQIAGKNTRVILTGDSQQHAPVVRGDAFRLVQHYSGLPVVEVTQIRRQEREIYKRAVAALSRGDLRTAFRRLDELGAIVELGDDSERYQKLAEDYLSFGPGGQPPLVVSPTHAEGKLVTDAIRIAKMQTGQLTDEREFVRFQNLQWDEADKKNAANYREGLVVQFHQNAKGIVRGSMLRVTGTGSEGEVLAVDGNGRKLVVPLKQAERFQVFERQAISFAKGDQIRITRNGESANGKRLSNGNIFTIEKFTRKGNIVLSNGAELDARNGHWTHGYCATSHSSQSKSVRHVLVAQSKNSFVASSREQFYVSVSRGKESIRIYTDDLQGLQEAVGNSSTRLSAVELAQLSAKEISAMGAALNSRQWRDAIKSRATEDGPNKHVRNLLRERRDQQPKKSNVISWQQYVQMRRGLVGPDGKSRSKGSPSKPEKKNGSNLANKRRSFLRPTEHSAPAKAQMKADAERKKAEATKQPDAAKQETKKPVKAPRSRTGRVAKALQSTADHFRKVAAKRPSPAKEQSKAPAKKGRLPQSELKQAAKHAVKAKAAETKRSGEARKQVKTKSQLVVRPPQPRK